MGQDQVTYQRATAASAVGLLVQLGLAIGVTLVALWSQGTALTAATWHLYGGLPIWIILTLIYHQHKIEREEALEAERLSRGDAAAAAIFAEHADDLDLARRRLARLYKWGLGVVSLLTSAYLIGAGIFLLYKVWNLEPAQLIDAALGEKARSNPMVLIALSAAPAFIAFIVARYVAGMTRIKEWQLLRGGASYLMGNVAVGVLTTIGAIVAAFENYWLAGYLAMVIPALMMLIGFEILLTFLLSAYRPRKPGEVPRPAFDSRVLGWFTSPESLGKIVTDTINYQFGFEISRSWFYQLLGRSMVKLTVFAIVTLLLVSCLVFVGPHQQAVITTNGGSPRVVDMGVYLKLPWPLGSAKKYDVGRIHQVTVGSITTSTKRDVAILWTNEHTEGDEGYMLTSPTPSNDWLGRSNPQETGSGMSLLAAEVALQYRISDLYQYLTAAQRPDEALRALADRRVTTYFVTHHDDDLLARGRTEAGRILQEQIQADADAFDNAVTGEKGLGVTLVFVSLTGIHPPQKNEVAAAYHEQIGALQEKESSIQTAYRDANQVLAEVAGTREQALEIDQAIAQLESLRSTLKRGETGAAGASDELKGKVEQQEAQVEQQEAQVEQLMAQARGRAAELIYEARAYRWDRAITERAKAERFASELMAYEQAPAFYRSRQYLNVLAEGMKDARKIILTVDQGEVPVFRLDLKDSQSALNTILESDN